MRNGFVAWIKSDVVLEGCEVDDIVISPGKSAFSRKFVPLHLVASHGVYPVLGAGAAESSQVELQCTRQSFSGEYHMNVSGSLSRIHDHISDTATR